MRLCIASGRHYSSLETEKIMQKNPVKLIFLGLTFKPEVRSSSETFAITKWTNQVLFCLGYLVQIK